MAATVWGAHAAQTSPAAESASPTEKSQSALALRDPFRPFVVVEKKPSGSPLEEYDLHALKLVAIIWSATSPRAMVEDATGLGYTIGLGTPIGKAGGVVKAIELDQVFVEEEHPNIYGEMTKTSVSLRLAPGEKKVP